jgi:hypothetical protein
MSVLNEGSSVGQLSQESHFILGEDKKSIELNCWLGPFDVVN